MGFELFKAGSGATSVKPDFGDLALSNRGGLLNPSYNITSPALTDFRGAKCPTMIPIRTIGPPVYHTGSLHGPDTLWESLQNRAHGLSAYAMCICFGPQASFEKQGWAERMRRMRSPLALLFGLSDLTI